MYNLIKQNKGIVMAVALLFSTTNIFAQNVADTEIKKNVQPLTSVLERLIQLQPSVYEFDTNRYGYLKLQQGKRYGFLADNVQAVFPELVSQKNVSYTYGKNNQRQAMLKSVDEASLIPFLVASIQEQQKQIQELRAAIEELRKK